ncbi:MAG: cupredoxin family copper-binding protein [Methanomassiliicoccus sp.]|nr:cupredoxin family copper-binding protein [Methanomassiliicoccus sp.]
MKRSTAIAAVIIILIVVVIVAAAAVLMMDQPGIYDPNGGTNETRPSGTGNTTSGGSAVNIQNFAFDPTPLTVPVGTTVTWTNNDSIAHTATSTSGPASFDSGLLDQGETYSYTFEQAGTYDYYCTPHPFMQAQIIVTGS